MTLIATYPDPLVEALAVHELFRKLGFSSSQIFMHLNPEPYGDIVVVLKHLGKQMSVTCGRLDIPDWEATWREFVEAYNSRRITEAEFRCRYSTLYAGTHHVDLIIGLGRKGIEPPGGRD